MKISESKLSRRLINNIACYAVYAQSTDFSGDLATRRIRIDMCLGIAIVADRVLRDIKDLHEFPHKSFTRLAFSSNNVKVSLKFETLALHFKTIIIFDRIDPYVTTTKSYVTLSYIAETYEAIKDVYDDFLHEALRLEAYDV